jgi:hypothetical protein
MPRRAYGHKEEAAFSDLTAVIESGSASRQSLKKCELSGRFALEPAPRTARRSARKRTPTTGRLLEHPTEVAHRFDPVRSLQSQSIQDRGEVVRDGAALVSAQLPACLVQEHEIPRDLDR